MRGSQTAGFAAALTAALTIAGPAAWTHGTEKHTTPAIAASAPDQAPKTSTGGEPLAIGIGGPFALVDQSGRPVTDKDFLGRYMLIFFGYANCPGICPTALKAMADALDDLGDDGEKVAPILITIDPEHDKPETLAPAVAKIHPQFIGLTGTDEELSATAAAYGVTSKLVGRSATGVDMFSHGSLVYLMGTDGKLLTIFPPVIDGRGIAAAIRGYLL